MKEIGLRLGLTSHEVGKKLKALGLRTGDGRPTPAAFGKGLVGQRWTADGRHYLWAWDVDRVLPLLPGPSQKTAGGTPPPGTARTTGDQPADGPKP